MDLLWPHDSRHLALVFRTLGVVDPNTGEQFTAERIDDVIQTIMEDRRLVEGWSTLPELDGDLRQQVHADVTRFLGVEGAAFGIDKVNVETRVVLGHGDDLRVLHDRERLVAGARLQERILLVSPWADLS